MAVPSSQGSRRRVDMSGTRHHVAVAAVPVGEAVAGQGFHVDVEGQEVVAGLDPVLQDVLEEEREP